MPTNHVLTMGTFDLLHAGHLDFLRQCKYLGELTVAVNSSEYVKFFKGYHPINSTTDRMELLRSLRFVDNVISNIGQCKNIIEHWHSCHLGIPGARIIAIGTSWAPEKYLSQIGITTGYLLEKGITLVYIHERHPEHTTHIIERAQKKLP